MTTRWATLAAVSLLLLTGCGGTPAEPETTTAVAETESTRPQPSPRAVTESRTRTPVSTPTGPVDTDDDGLNDSRERALGTNVSLADTDEDALQDGREVGLGSDPLRADTDRDGLDDGAEVLATDALPGADPLHRDIFLEVDYMRGERPDGAMLATVERRFDAAPVSNPDGERGIDLHVRLDEELSARDTVVAAHRPGELDDVFDYRQRFAQRHRRGHYYAVVVRSIRYPNESVRDLQGYAYADFFVSENPADPGVQDNVFMHELGHVVGLGPWRYPGIDTRRVPFDTYPSAMNYRAPGDHLRFADGSGSPAGFDDWQAIATCHSWAGYDDFFPVVDGENATGRPDPGGTALSAGVGCL